MLQRRRHFSHRHQHWPTWRTRQGYAYGMHIVLRAEDFLPLTRNSLRNRNLKNKIHEHSNVNFRREKNSTKSDAIFSVLCFAHFKPLIEPTVSLARPFRNSCIRYFDLVARSPFAHKKTISHRLQIAFVYVVAVRHKEHYTFRSCGQAHHAHTSHNRTDRSSKTNWDSLHRVCGFLWRIFFCAAVAVADLTLFIRCTLYNIRVLETQDQAVERNEWKKRV